MDRFNYHGCCGAATFYGMRAFQYEYRTVNGKREQRHDFTPQEQRQKLAGQLKKVEATARGVRQDLVQFIITSAQIAEYRGGGLTKEELGQLGYKLVLATVNRNTNLTLFLYVKDLSKYEEIDVDGVIAYEKGKKPQPEPQRERMFAAATPPPPPPANPVRRRRAVQPAAVEDWGDL